MSWLTVGVLLSGSWVHGEQTSDAERPLSTTVEISAPVLMAGGQIHSHDFLLTRGDFLHLRVVQQGIDVRLRWLSPDGDLKWEVDSPTEGYGREELVEIAPETGRYRLELVAEVHDAEPGQYLFRQLAHRPATGDDHRHFTAESSYRTALEQLLERTYRPAAELLTESLEVWRELGIPHREADTLERLGAAQRRLGDWTAAASSYEQAVIWNRTLARPRRLASTLLNLGASHLRLARLESARSQLTEAKSLFHAQGNARGETTALLRLGTVDYRQGRFQAALDAFQQTLAQSGDLGRSSLRASILTSRAWALLGLHRPQEALDDLMEAYRIYLNRQQPRYLASVISGVAQALVQLDDFDNAERRAREAVEVLVAFDDLRSRAMALLHLGNVLDRRADLQGAQRAFESSLELARQAGDAHCQAVALNGLGHVRAQAGAAGKALEHHDQAATLFRQIGDRKGEAASRVRGARALRDLGRFQEAWERLEPALDAVDDIREETTRQDFRLEYFGFRQEYYEIALDVLMGLHEQYPRAGYDARAILINDRRLGRELLDRRTRHGRHSPDPTWVEEERRLEQRLRELAQRPDEGEGRERLSDLVAELHRVRGEMYRATSMELSRPDPLDLDRAAKQLLDRDSMLLIYALGDAQSFLWTVSSAGRSAHRLPARDEIESRALALGDVLTRWTERSETSFTALSQELSDLLLAPVVEQLENRRLIIVSEGALLSLPFSALPKPGSDQWLIELHEIAHLPSISTLVSLRQPPSERSAPQRAVALFADPIFTQDDPRLGAAARSSGTSVGSSASERVANWHEDLQRTADRLGVDPYRRLPGSQVEAEKIRELAIGGRPFLASGLDASRETFLSTPLADFSVLHLATHALVHPRPELSGLVLSLVGEDGRPQDGFLRTFEIARLDLPLDLVVLSACETSGGPEVRGEGSLGLAWGFLQAGARRVVASLWRVSDSATAELMTAFYTAYLQRGIPPAAALREAQLVLLQRPDSRPRDWASFIFHGDWHKPRSYLAPSSGSPQPSGDVIGEAR